MKSLRSLLALALVLVAVPAWAQRQTGSITGAVTDEQGGALSSVTVTLTGKAGAKTAATDAEGVYRFPAVDPGIYEIRAEMSGFQGVRQETVVVSIGQQLTIDFALKVASMAETVDVVETAPVVDVTSSSTSNTVSQDLLFNMPFSRTAIQLLNTAPGVNNFTAYGGGASTGNSLLLDGVETRDPDGGSEWVFPNFNWIEEVQLGGIGAAAEYGGFTGGIVNSITRSGGNRFAALFDGQYTRGSWSTDNIQPEQAALNPNLTPDKTVKYLDVTAQLSGPLIRDKLFFFASVQRFENNYDPPGARTLRTEVSPRFLLKTSYQPRQQDQVTLLLEYDRYNQTGRGSTLAEQDASVEQDSPEVVWNLQWRHLFGSKTFGEIKYTGWTGFFDLNPQFNRTSSGHFDATSNAYTVSSGYTAYYDRGRNQLNAAVSHFADAFGKHDLKFGLEIERSRVRNRLSYTNNLFYYDYTAYYPVGQYYAYNYGYDLNGRNSRESVYVQDAWKPTDRLTINAGGRADFIRGKSPDGPKVYDVKNYQPRLGFAFDLTGDQKTVVKGHYGQYYEGAFFAPWSRATPGKQDFVGYCYDPGGDVTGPEGNTFGECNRLPLSTLYRVDPDIKHPRVDEWTAGIERALSGDVRLAVTGISRDSKNFINSVLPDARWTPITLVSDLEDREITPYRWANPSESNTNFLITNPAGFEYRDPSGNVLGVADPYRKYRALMVVLSKRYTHRWQGQISYVLSKTEGTVDNNDFAASTGASRQYETPTTGILNADGLNTNDRRHEIKAYASVQVPVIEVGINASFRSMSGRPYTPFQGFRSRDINFPFSAGRTVLLEPRGSRRRERENIVDLRLEKIFKTGDTEKFGLYADIRNVFNSSTPIVVVTRVPEEAILGVDVPFGAPRTLTPPRQFTLGARWSF